MSKSLKKLKKGVGLAQEVAALGSALGMIVGAATKKKKSTQPAKAAKTKKSKSKKKSKETALNSQSSTRRSIAAPVTVGFQHRHVRHKPFVMTGRCIMATLQTSATSVSLSVLGNADGVNTTQLNLFMVEPTGGGQETRNFKMFPDVVRNVAYMFEKYRVHKLKVTWEPLVGTNSPQSVVFGSMGTQSVTNTTKSYYDIAAWNNNVITPAWCTASLDLMKDSGFTRDWLYQEAVVPETVDDLRFESPGLFGASVLNGSLSTLYGTFWLEYEIEFDQLHAINSLYMKPLVSTQPWKEHVVVDSLPAQSPALPAGQDPSPEAVTAAKQLLSQIQQQADDGKSASSTPSLVSGSATPARPGWFQASQRYAGLENR